jgi:hypothetical protein
MYRPPDDDFSLPACSAAIMQVRARHRSVGPRAGATAGGGLHVDRRSQTGAQAGTIKTWRKSPAHLEPGVGIACWRAVNQVVAHHGQPPPASHLLLTRCWHSGQRVWGARKSGFASAQVWGGRRGHRRASAAHPCLTGWPPHGWPPPLACGQEAGKAGDVVWGRGSIHAPSALLTRQQRPEALREASPRLRQVAGRAAACAQGGTHFKTLSCWAASSCGQRRLPLDWSRPRSSRPHSPLLAKGRPTVPAGPAAPASGAQLDW